MKEKPCSANNIRIQILGISRQNCMAIFEYTHTTHTHTHEYNDDYQYSDSDDLNDDDMCVFSLSHR